MEEQEKIVWAGVFTEHRKTQEATISHYSFENFFVEA